MKAFVHGATHKMQEAAADFMVSVRVGLQQLLHHGQEVFVNGQYLLDVGEQNLREKNTELSTADKHSVLYSVADLKSILQHMRLFFFCGRWW